MAEKMTYAGAGIDYDAMDPFKRAATRAAQETDGNANARRFGLRPVSWSRGESCFLMEGDAHYLAHVEEGLGTKNLIADAVGWGYEYIGQDAVAMIVNDMITSGALPVSLAMHLAVGSGDWFKNRMRVAKLIEGWRCGCDLSGAVWGGGETPTLKDIVYPDGSVISGSAVGIVAPKSNVIQPKIEHGDRIVFLLSNGVHANGLTLARDLHLKVAGGYEAEIRDHGAVMSYGYALLRPTPIYVPVVRACLDEGIPIHYAVNITGHGWRKLMRAPEPFVYVIEKLPGLLPVFEFIMEHGPVLRREMYATYNMGAGFALYVSPERAEHVVEIADRWEIDAIVAGRIEKRGDEKKVVIEPEGIEFESETLRVR